MAHTSGENIEAALKLLEEAAQQKKDELGSVISDKYTHLRSLIMEKESNLMKTLANAKDSAVEAAIHAKDATVDKAREVAHDVNKSVHHNPWPYIAGAAGIGALLGFVLGRSRK
ncbi:MAG: hypothetical protein WCL44_12130 [bacterium]